MLTAGDEYPIHQAPEPVALVTDRNFYDRFFFNGYSPDGRIFFAAAMGIYPALDVVDGAFCISVDGVQHNVRASARLNGDRMAMRVGPISISVDIALHAVTLRVAENDSGLAAELRFTGRHFPIEEPRFTRRNGTRLFMDYTRMTQNGRWAGWVSMGGARHVVDDSFTGTRDRSWGIRPVGAADAQPAPMDPQFFWLWTPCNFADCAVYLHTNDDGNGLPWNRRAAIYADGAGRHGGADMDAPAIAYSFIPGTRRVDRVVVDLRPGARLTLTPVAALGSARGYFYMNGLGYTHPIWGHGMEHGENALAYDRLDLANIADGEYANMHIQAVADAVLDVDGATHHGRGVVEQMFFGPHAPTGLTGLFDPAPAGARA
ncbi:MAG: hypothetical protein ACKOUM_12220 [Sphingopyxis sp.]